MIRKVAWFAKEAKLRVRYMTSKECIFCKIIKGEMKSIPILDNNSILAINDINPVAQIHILIIPKKHIESVETVNNQDASDVIEMFKAAQELVKEKKLDAYRLAFNAGRFQHVGHLHMHLLSGGSVKWEKL